MIDNENQRGENLGDNEELSKKEDRIIELLEEILKWTRFDVLQKAKEVLLDTLKKDTEKIAYQYSDGKSSLEISKMAGVSDFAIRSYWKKWAAMGLVLASSRYKGRYEKLFSLEDLSIEVPKTRASSTPKEPLAEEGSEEMGDSAKVSQTETREV
jgi:transposase